MFLDKVFDVLCMETVKGSKCLLGTQLYQRKHALDGVFQEEPGILETVKVQKVKTVDDVSKYLKELLEERSVTDVELNAYITLTLLTRCTNAPSGEGLIVKHPLSTYILAGRETTWIKVKPGQSATWPRTSKS